MALRSSYLKTGEPGLAGMTVAELNVLPMFDLFFDNLLRFLGGNVLLAHAVTGAFIALATLLIGKMVKLFLDTVVRKIISKTNNDLDDRILDIVLERVIAFSGIYGLYLGMEELRSGLGAKHTLFLTMLDYSDNLLFILFAILLTSIVIKITRAVITNIFSSLARKNHFEEFGQSLPLLTNRIASFVIIAVAAIVVLDRFGQNIGSILTILGAGSLALGLAAQDTISNMISGFIIMVDRPFRVGDRIKIPTGETGDVYEIGLRSTKILDFDNNLVIVPNNDLVKTRIVNFHYPQNETRVVIDVSVAYGSEIDSVKQIMFRAAQDHPDVLKNPVPEVYLMKLADWSMNFSLFCRVADFKMQFKTAESLRIRIYNELNKAKIEIPYPQQAVQLKTSIEHALRTSQKRKKISR